jgi:hypothetical protein
MIEGRRSRKECLDRGIVENVERDCLTANLRRDRIY